VLIGGRRRAYGVMRRPPSCAAAHPGLDRRDPAQRPHRPADRQVPGRPRPLIPLGIDHLAEDSASRPKPHRSSYGDLADTTSGGLTVRRFRNDAVRIAGVRHTRTGWTRWPCWWPRPSDPLDGCPAAYGRRPPAQTRSGPCDSHAWTWQLMPRAAGYAPRTTALAGHGPGQARWPWSVSGRHGQPRRSRGTRAVLPWTLRTLPLWLPSCRPGSGHPPDTLPRPLSAGGCGG
jgi:hypothetical protein